MAEFSLYPCPLHNRPGYAREHEPCIIFMDEIDAIGGRRFSEGTSADREIQRTLMELLNCMDGFDSLGQTKMIMATNRPDTLDPALLRPGRLDRKIEIPLPNEVGRMEILKIHSAGVTKHGEIGMHSGVIVFSLFPFFCETEFLTYSRFGTNPTRLRVNRQARRRIQRRGFTKRVH